MKDPNYCVFRRFSAIYKCQITLITRDLLEFPLVSWKPDEKEEGLSGLERLL